MTVLMVLQQAHALIKRQLPRIFGVKKFLIVAIVHLSARYSLQVGLQRFRFRIFPLLWHLM